MPKRTVVITTINGITPGIREFGKRADWQVILVGDHRTPQIDVSPYPSMAYLSLRDQELEGFGLTPHLPLNHYSRKNFGYLLAMRARAECIADTDDDNIPYTNWPRWDLRANAIDTVVGPKFVNVYSLFTNRHIWPRGFPLRLVAGSSDIRIEPRTQPRIVIWQGLADGDPDVDAVYRLIIGRNIHFRDRAVVAMGNGVYAPVNSQNTIWLSEAYPFLYLPVSVSMRFTDILRGYIAQRGLHAMGARVGFTPASVKQSRNPHDIMQDFRDEIPCYLQAEEVVELLDDLDLKGDPAADLRSMYRELSLAGVVAESEAVPLNAWLEDVHAAGWTRSV